MYCENIMQAGRQEAGWIQGLKGYVCVMCSAMYSFLEIRQHVNIEGKLVLCKHRTVVIKLFAKL